ncbi:U2 snRNP-associated SURP motif-containing protein-like [Tribolium madens]|uniref:U2 snRNP-associated SURP motif-containing protein-like n=1 Tax=Tribolium madens TaxID=41895 RepID=UPI001CF728FF|nr:U2 snRNP-associated SURP motif-containing protein-like [Tribolium madens]
MHKRGQVNKKSLEEEQQAIGAIYKQYIDTFQENSDIPRKTFVKSDTLYAEGKENAEKGQLYNPKPFIQLKKQTPNPQAPFLSSSKRTKKKSNLKALGDELKMLQHERQVKEIHLVVPKLEPSPLLTHESDYTNSTNLFVSNLNPQITENHLIQMFGTYGPLASVKIMWPRNETSSRGANCGFVAFMSRSDAERAMNGLKNHEMRINWGKSVKIPPYPIHIPPELYKLYAPPPPSGLPFNAQPCSEDLSQAVVKVTIPFDRNLLMIIHRMIEFVIREGPEFEAVIMDMESGNSEFKFLSDFQDPAHTYYRWKLYSLLNGEPKNSWSMKPFRMYKNGSIWVPPTAPNYREGMPQELIKSPKTENLSETQTARLVSLIKHLTTTKSSISEAMVFCFNHCNALGDILQVLVDSFKNVATNPVKKLARLYLLSDILYNCKVRQIRCEKFTQEVCLEIFNHLHSTYKELHHAQDKVCFKIKIFAVLRAWLLHHFYDVKFVTKLENVLLTGNENGEDDDNSLNDEPLDGANLLKRSYHTATTDCLIVEKKPKQFVDMFN